MDDLLSISGRLLLVLALVAANGLFVAAEFAIVTARRARIETLAAEGNRVAALVRRTFNDLGNYLAAAQLGITMASIALGFVGEPLIADLFEPLLEDLIGESAAGVTAHAIAVPTPFPSPLHPSQPCTLSSANKRPRCLRFAIPNGSRC